MTSAKAKDLNHALRSLSVTDRMALIADHFPALVFTTNFGTEDQLLTWAIINAGVQMKIKTHLTGKLLEHSQTLRAITQSQYAIDIPQDASDNHSVWISGRAQQAQNADLNAPLAIWYDDKQMLEINPLADWTLTQLLQAVAEHEVPINPITAYQADTLRARPAKVESPEPKRGGAKQTLKAELRFNET